MTRYLIDLETLGKLPGCIVGTIGAVRFSSEGIHDTFYRRIDLRDAERMGLTIDMDTLLWWRAQNPEAQAEMFGEGAAPRVRVVEALLDLKRFLGGDAETATIYGNSPAFDLSILEEVYRRCGVMTGPAPWNFRNERCVRTEMAMYERLGVPVGEVRASVRAKQGSVIRHHALHDAVYEADLLIACERWWGENGGGEVGSPEGSPLSTTLLPGRDRTT